MSTRSSLLSGTLVTSLGTLASRVLGLVRDMVTAALFGLTAGGVMDALVVAFRIPNLFRALFGEGALTASYMPVFTQALKRDRESAWHLFAAMVRWLSGVLFAVVLVGEIGIGLWALVARDNQPVLLLAGLSAAMLPYLLLVCLAAFISATLQGVGRFAAAAFAPALLNVVWILGAAVIAPRLTADAVQQAYIVAGCVMVGGVLQCIVQLPSLRRADFRFSAHVGAEHESIADDLRQIRRGMIPVALALAVVQLNTLMDSLVAWGLSAPADSPSTVAWLGGVRYPMKAGAVAALYFGERLYQFPLGLLGVAVATAVFPLLSHHAARGDRTALAGDLSKGLRLVLLGAVPCSVGLVILAEPIARLFFEHGRFTSEDAARAARMIAVYGSGVWAYCALPVIVRGFYAVGDRVTPLRMSLAAVALNLTLDLTLIWPLAEAGLALATVVSAIVQMAAMAVLFSKAHVALDWPRIWGTGACTMIATGVMAAVGMLLLERIATSNTLVRVAGPIAGCAVAYIGTLALVGRASLQDLFRRG